MTGTHIYTESHMFQMLPAEMTFDRLKAANPAGWLLERFYVLINMKATLRVRIL